MSIYWPFMLALAVVAFVAFGRDHAPLTRTTWAVLANWVVNTAFVMASGVYDPFWLFLAVDVATAAIILVRPAGFIQALLGTTYLVQVAMHCGYGWALVSNIDRGEGYNDMRLLYWQALTATAWGQLAVLLFWGAWHGRKGRYIRDILHRHRVPDAAHRSGDVER